MIGIIIAAIAAGEIGQRLGTKYLDGAQETPYWTGHIDGDIGKAAVSITMLRYLGKTSYRLFIVTEGQWAWWNRASIQRFWELFRFGSDISPMAGR